MSQQTKFVSLASVFAVLAAQQGCKPEDLRIALEVEDPNRPFGEPTWCLRADGTVGRDDGKFYRLEMETGAYPRPVMFEEPNTPPVPADGSPRPLGAVMVIQRADGKIRVERKGSLTDAQFRLRLPRASNSNPDALPPGEHRGWFEANNERIRGGIRGGQIEARYAQMEFPDTEAMSLEEFREHCTDGLSRAALDIVFGGK